jgi:type III secretion protein W
MSGGIEGPAGFRAYTDTGGREGREAGAQPQQRGVRAGEAVVVKDGHSILDNALEELTFGAAERRNQRDVGDRRLTGGSQAYRVERVQQIEEYLDKLHDVDKLKMRDLAVAVRQRQERGDLDEEGLRQALEEFHPDITYQQAALEYLAAELEDSGDRPEALALVHQVLVENERAFGPEIRAGLNVTPAALERGATPEDVQGLRDFYREGVVKPDSLKASSATILERAGGKDFDKQVSFLIRAMGDELATVGPSVERGHLKTMLDNIYALELLRTLHEQGGEMLGLVDRSHNLNTRPRLDEMIGQFLDKVEGSWLQGQEIAAIGTNIGVRGLQAEILFLTELGKVARSIPDKAHHDPAKAEQLKDAIQDALNSAIELEEAEEGAVP